MQNSSKRVALVTGANKGIGLEIARQLARAGLRVLLGSRDPDAGHSAAAQLQELGLDAQSVELDLMRPETVQAAARMIEAEFGRLDVLVNNAGIADAADEAPSKASIDAVRRVMDTNFFGTLMVTQTLLPLLRRSNAARVVNVSSGLGSIALNGDPGWEFAGVKRMGYNPSKAALNMLTVQRADELRETSIKVNSADPGFTATDLNAHRGYRTVEQGAAEAIRLVLLPADGPAGGFFSSRASNPW